MSERMPGLPAPTPTPITEGYWRSAGEGRFVIQRCDNCGTHRHPPSAVCYECLSTAWSWDDGLPGTGRVFSYIWVHRPQYPELSALVPYSFAVIEMDQAKGTVRVTGNVHDVTMDELTIDLPVAVIFDPCGEGLALPSFVPRKS